MESVSAQQSEIEILRRQIAALEQANNELAERLHLFAGATREGVAVHGKGRILEANAAFAALFGYLPEEVTGRNPLDFIAPDARQDARQRALTDYNEPYESTGLRRDGSTFPAEFCGKTHLYQGQKTRIWLVRDLSATKEALSRLERSEARYRAAVSASFEVVWSSNGTASTDPAWQDWWEQLTGQTRDEQRDWKWLDSLHPEDREHARAVWNHALSTGSPFDVQYRVRSKEGAYRMLDVRGVPVSSPEGGAREWVGTARDITEQHQLQKELLNHSRLLKVAPVFARDLDHRITFWNGGAERLYGFTEAEALGRRCFDLLSSTPAASDSEVVHELLKTGTWSGTVQRRSRDGSPIVVLSHCVLHRGDSGEPEAIVETANDITAQADAERRLAVIANSLPVLISYIDSNQQYRFLNKSYERWFGFKGSDMHGRHMREVVGPAAYEKLRPHVEAALGGVTQTFEEHVDYQTAGEHDIRATYVPDGQPGDVRGFYVLVEDVTEWKRAERELHRNQAHIAAVFAQATAGLAQTDLTGQFTLVNDRFCEIVGRTREDLLAIRMQDITAPEDVGRNVPLFRRAVENGEPFVIEKQYVRPDGSFVWVNNSVTAVRDEQGHAHGVLAVSIDVTERKRTEEALRLRERTLRYTYEQAPVGIGESDLHGTFTRVNPAFCRLVGYSETELIGRNVADLLWPDDIERDREEITAIISAESDSLRMEKRCRHKQGHAVWVELTVSVIHDDEGRPISGIGIVQDISARKRALEELAGAKKQNENILSSITESFMAVDRDWRFTYVNDRVVRRTGRSKQELIGRRLWDVFPEAANSPLWTAYHRCMEERVPVQFESPYPGRTSEQAGWFEVHAYPTDDGICAYVLDITARKAAEEALAWQARLLDLSHEPILAWDLEEGSVRFWNHGAEIMYGWAGEDALGQMVHSLLRTRRDVPFDEVKRQLEDTGTWVGELNHTTRDGRQLVMESRQELVREPGGRPLVLETNRDITDRKRADEALLASEAQLRRTSGQFLLAATAMRALIYDWDPASDHVERLRGFEEVTGYHLDEVPPTAAWWREQIHPNDRASLDRAANAPREEIRVSEYRVRHKLGHYVWVRDAAMRLHDEFGVGRVVGCTVDISEQKHAELALQEREEFYRTLGEAVPDFIWTANKEGETLYANRRLCEYLGMSLDEINELGWRINHVDDIPELRQRWNEAARLGQPFEAEYRYRRHDGTYRWFMGRAVPVKDAQGEIAHWIGTSTDIHRLKLAEESLRRYNEQLEEFAYAAAHDMQEPLRTVGIYVQLIQRRLRDQLDEETEAYLQVVRDNSERMGVLVRDLLTYAQATDAPGETAPRTDCELVLNQVLANLESAIASTNTDVTVGDLPWVALHEAHLVQLFQNLLGNAIKYRSTERTPKVAITARPAEGAWVFTVADNGIGIRPEYRERVFGVFKRLHGRDVAGTGIGLAICKRIVEHYGGRIWVDSDGDSGSTFCFTLPAALSESSSKRDS